jgi:hypothetical protein
MPTDIQEASNMTRKRELELLSGMARCFRANTGRLPTTVEEIGDHWYELSDRIVVREHIDEDGNHHPAQTLFELDAPGHCLECIWLREVEKRPDAGALLAEALAME